MSAWSATVRCDCQQKHDVHFEGDDFPHDDVFFTCPISGRKMIIPVGSIVVWAGPATPSPESILVKPNAQ